MYTLCYRLIDYVLLEAHVVKVRVSPARVLELLWKFVQIFELNLLCVIDNIDKCELKVSRIFNSRRILLNTALF